MAYEVELILLYVPLDAQDRRGYIFRSLGFHVRLYITRQKQMARFSPLFPSGICSNTSGLLLHHLLIGRPALSSSVTQSFCSFTAAAYVSAPSEVIDV
jgi:hypothetical protein